MLFLRTVKSAAPALLGTVASLATRVKTAKSLAFTVGLVGWLRWGSRYAWVLGFAVMPGLATRAVGCYLWAWWGVAPVRWAAPEFGEGLGGYSMAPLSGQGG